MALEFDLNVDPMGNLGVTTRETHYLDHDKGITEMTGYSAFVEGSRAFTPDALPAFEATIRGPEIIDFTQF